LITSSGQGFGLIDRVAYPDTSATNWLRSAEPSVCENTARKWGHRFFRPNGFFKLLSIMMGESSSVDRRGRKSRHLRPRPLILAKVKAACLKATEGSTHHHRRSKVNNDKAVVAPCCGSIAPVVPRAGKRSHLEETQVIKKPIVASMGDVAASGGYYISMGRQNFRLTSTTTGSIGVVGGKLAMKGLFDKVGITTETTERGKNSGFSLPAASSPTRSAKSSPNDARHVWAIHGGRPKAKHACRQLRSPAAAAYTQRQAKENGLSISLARCTTPSTKPGWLA
jgi:protease-4